VDMPYRLAGEEPHHFAQYLVQAIARGANPSTYIMGTPDVVDYECLDIGAEIIRFHRDHTEVYKDLVPDAQVLLIRPDTRRHMPGRFSDVTAEFEGLYLSLLERHIGFDVLPERKLSVRASSGNGLRQYRLMVLPDLGSLDPDFVRVVDKFVESGGSVVSTGSSGFDGDDVQPSSFPISRRLAIRDTVESVRSMHLSVHAGERVLPVPVIGAIHIVEPKAEADADVWALSRAPYGPPEKCHGHLPLEQPGIVTGRAGQGAVAVLPWTVGRAYREVGLSAHRDLFADTLLQLDPGVVTRTGIGGGAKLPEQVEVVLGRAAVGQVIHLLNRTGDADQRFRATVPIASATLAVSSANSRVQALIADRELSVQSDGEEAFVQLPEIGLFEVLLIERDPVSGPLEN
jgi:hypothetical protein